MLATSSRIFMNSQMHWTLRATCSDCHCETIAPLLMSNPVCCEGCSAVIKIDPRRTLFHRREDPPAVDPKA
jgi:hypothetical protein